MNRAARRRAEKTQRKGIVDYETETVRQLLKEKITGQKRVVTGIHIDISAARKVNIDTERLSKMEENEREAEAFLEAFEEQLADIEAAEAEKNKKVKDAIS